MWEMEYLSNDQWWKIGFSTIVGLVVYRYEDKYDAEHAAQLLRPKGSWRVVRAVSAIKDK